MSSGHFGVVEASGDIMLDDRADAATQRTLLGQKFRGWYALMRTVEGVRSTEPYRPRCRFADRRH